MNAKMIISTILLCLCLPPTLNAEVKDTILTFDASLLRVENAVAEEGATAQYAKVSYGRKGEITGRVETPGHPELPLCHYTITLPYNARDIEVTCKTVPGESFMLDHEIYPVQHPIPTGIGYKRPAFCTADSAAYAGKYPAEAVSVTDISSIGDGDKMVGINVCPITYYPQENRCELAKSVSVRVSYTLDKARQAARRLAPQESPTLLPFYEYCVITPRRFKDAFARLIGWERQKGLNAGVVCVEDILSDPAIVGDTVSHIYDDAGKVRQYLQYAYKYGDTKYVLFGGNDQMLPIRYGTGANNTYVYWDDDEELHIPSDFYFAELNSNWNRDNDGFYGEPQDMDDYIAELQVGRLLCVKTEDIENYTDKLMRYEINPGNGDYSYLRRAFLTQANELQDSAQAEIISERLMDLFPERVILSCGTHDHPTNVTGTDIVKAMRRHYGYVSWFNHGSPTAIIVNNGAADYQNRHVVASVTGDTILAPKEEANGLDSLQNEYYPMVAYSLGCTLAPFDCYSEEYANTVNIGQSFTLGKDYGGVAFVGNSRVGWIDNSYKVQLWFNQYMEDHTLASSLNWAKRFNNARKHHHALVVNVIGSPNIKIWTDTPQPFNASMEYQEEMGMGADLLTESNITNGNFIIRYLVENGDSLFSGTFAPSYGTVWLGDVQNGIVTLTGRNCLPQVMPLRLQNLSFNNCQHLITSDVRIGSDVRPEDQGDVLFKAGSKTGIEHTGKVILTKGVSVERGAELRICPTALQNKLKDIENEFEDFDDFNDYDDENN